MKVVVLGGYGVFGTRIVRLLARDGHAVSVAGRSQQKAQALADEIGATALVLDRHKDLSPIWAHAPDVVIDAAGPFHDYGADPYALARACVAHGVHYLDLADDPGFCAGIGVLDEIARKAGVFALSGVSSVPAISSSAVAALSADALEVDTISTAILPGNRAPRGRAVVDSILHQCGTEFDIVLDGDAVPVRSWSRSETFDLGDGLRRRGWLIEVPDNRLFSQAFGARSVFFRAGLELGVMNWSLALWSWSRGRLGVRHPRFLSGLVLRLARLLWPFGTDEGGMSVAVTARYVTGWQRRTWRLIANAGEGPLVPAVAARSLLRQPDTITPGARPAVAPVSLEAITTAIDDLAISTEVITEDIVPIFPAYLGAAFADLPPPVQDAHQVFGPRRWQGRASVTRGKGLWSRLLAGLFRFPPATDDVAVTVTMMPDAGGEIWDRQFGTRGFRSTLRIVDGQMTERFGPLTFTLGLHVADAALHFPVLAGRLGWLPLPRIFLPQSETREYVRDGRFLFDVALRAPLTSSLMVHYRGWLERSGTEART